MLGFPKHGVLARLAAMKRRCRNGKRHPRRLDMTGVPSPVDPERPARRSCCARTEPVRGRRERGVEWLLGVSHDRERGDFAEARMAQLGVSVIEPGAFLTRVFKARPDETGRAVRQAVEDLRSPPYSLEESLWALRAHGARTMVDSLASKWGVIPAKKPANEKGRKRDTRRAKKRRALSPAPTDSLESGPRHG